MKKKIIGILSIFAILTIVLTACSNSSWDSITNNPKTVKSSLQKSLYKKKTILVLMDAKCKDCERDRSTIISNVKKARNKGYNVLVFDVRKVDRSGFNYLLHNIPGVNDRNGIDTPTLVELRPSSQHHFYVAEQVLHDTATTRQINEFFESAGER